MFDAKKESFEETLQKYFAEKFNAPERYHTFDRHFFAVEKQQIIHKKSGEQQNR